MHDTTRSAIQRWGLIAVLALLLLSSLNLSRWTSRVPFAPEVATPDRTALPLRSPDPGMSDASVTARPAEAMLEADQASLDWLERIVLNEADAGSRLIAIEQLRMIASPASVELLGRMLSDPEAVVREQALLALGEKGFTAIPALGQAMISDPDAALRSQSIDLLARIDGPASTAMLRYASMHDPLQSLRDHAGAMLLGRPALQAVEQVAQDKDREFYDDQFQAAWSMPEDEAVEVLGEIYADATAEDIRRQALIELAHLGTDQSIDLLSKGLNDPSHEVRAETLYLLADQSDNTLRLLGQALLGDRSPDLRATALELISEFTTPAADALLLLGMSDEDEVVRERARELIGEY
jgi:HEAT repeat protein